MSWFASTTTYDGKLKKADIISNLDKFAYDKREACCYHRYLTLHEDKIYKDIDDAYEAITEYINKSKWNGRGDDHAVQFKDGRKKMWLVRYSYHC